jgi:riboflavin kinase/FMN adenylyltransferase
MTHVLSLEGISLPESWLTIGVFDGVHRGHQEIIRRLVAGALSAKVPSVVLTFWPHPAKVLGDGRVRCLTTANERAALLSELGVDTVITHRFDAATAGTSAQDFVAVLQQKLGFRRLLIGYDFALGKGREGNAARLAEIGRLLNYEVEVVPALSDESGVISSTEIRKLVATGDVATAAGLLGHPYSLEGPVVTGDGRGRELGFPTANIDYPEEKILPANGIYACWAWLDGARRAAAVNVGVRPQFHPDAHKPLVEAHILDLQQQLYGIHVRLDFVERLRDEMRFPTVAHLVEQIERDVQQTRQLLAPQASA